MAGVAAERAAATASARVVADPAFGAARHVVVYVPTDHEIDPAPIVLAALDAGKTVYYPRIAEGTLEFVGAGSPTFRLGAGGVPEALGGVRLSAATPSVLFVVPGVGFDLRGTRLGRGSGHYDRALAAHSGAVRFGLAFECQIVARLPEAPWDVRMHAVATEARLVWGAGAVRAAFVDAKEI